jgi:hypothetical protein
MLELSNLLADRTQASRGILRYEVRQTESSKMDLSEIQDGGSRHLENRQLAVTSKVVDLPSKNYVSECPKRTSVRH